MNLQQHVEGEFKKLFSDKEQKMVFDALAYAAEKYRGKKRLSGDPALSHPLEAVKILLRLKPDAAMIIATLLHEVPKFDEGYFEEIQKRYGPEPALLLQGVRKLSLFQIKHSDRQLELLRRMFLTMAKDVRVILIKLADRLHNMRTLEYLPPDQRHQIAHETQHIYAPLAGRLGVFAIKAPLEDLSFFYLHPRRHKDLSTQIMRHEVNRERIINSADKKLTELLKQAGIDGRVVGRVKNIYSVHKKMLKKQFDNVDDIYDIFAMRIIVPQVSDCYAMLGKLHEFYLPLSNRFKDYIAVPKPNGYRSLHTTVLGLSGATKKSFPIEIQISTEEMNDEAEFGVASHWFYKEKGSKQRAMCLRSVGPQEWVEGLIEMEEHLREDPDFMRETVNDSFSEHIFAITPHGDILDLPLGATPIDFAFALHSDLGMQMRMAKANGKAVALDYKIQSGDVLEIITGAQVRPSQNWLSLCVTAKAKNKLRSYFKTKDTATLIQEGKVILNRALKRFGYPELDKDYSILKNYKGKQLTKQERIDVLEYIGGGSIAVGSVIKDLAERSDTTAQRRKILQTSDKRPNTSKGAPDTKKPKVIVSGIRGMPIKIAACCKPKSVDPIVGFVTIGKRVTIHKTTCRLIEKLNPERLIDARFEGQEKKYQTTLIVKRGIDRVGVINDILRVFVEKNTNVLDIRFLERSNVKANIEFDIEFNHWDDCIAAVNAVAKVKSVVEVKRVER